LIKIAEQKLAEQVLRASESKYRLLFESLPQRIFYKDKNLVYISCVGILGILWDVTEKVALERESVRSQQLAALGELAVSVAHEINNSVTGVINYAQILYNKHSEGSKENNLAYRIIKEGDRIADIVQSLLSFARAGDTGKDKDKNTASIHKIVSDTLILLKAQLRKDGIKVKVDIPKKLPQVLVHTYSKFNKSF
jgi:signal transduction histidine kinase